MMVLERFLFGFPFNHLMVKVIVFSLSVKEIELNGSASCGLDGEFVLILILWKLALV